MFRRFGIGLTAAWSGLLLLIGSGAAAAAPILGSSPWTAPAHYGPRALLPTAHGGDASLAAAHYRWRPTGVPRAAPSVRPPWAAAYRPPQAFVHPFAGVGYSRHAFAPPRPADWRRSGPMVVSVDGRPYRFRPVSPWRPPLVAMAPRLSPPAAFVPPPAWAPPAVIAAQRSWPTLPVAWPSHPPQAQSWGQPMHPPGPDGRLVYRFRPDARFPGGLPTPVASAPWLGQAAGGPRDARLGDGGRSGWEPNPRPQTMRAGTVAYLYN